MIPHEELSGVIEGAIQRHRRWSHAQITDEVLGILAQRPGVTVEWKCGLVVGLSDGASSYMTRHYIYRWIYEQRR